MKIGRRALGYFLAATFLALTFTAVAQPDPDSGRSLEGAWQVSITLRDGLPFCAPAGALATRDGLVLAESCYASEGAGYGVWARRDNGQFAITFTGNSFGPDNTVNGKYKVRATVTLAPNRNSISGHYKTDFFDVGGHPAGSTTGTVSGVRIPLEPGD